LYDAQGRSLLHIDARPDGSDVIVTLHHPILASDPLLYAHLTDTMTGRIHVLLYIINDLDGPRFAVDRMPDGSPTRFGTMGRNLGEEERAMHAGLAPGQVRPGLRILGQSVESFESFVGSLGQDVYFVEPLFYHNAAIFEGYGFGYQQGRRLMERIDRGFQPGGALALRLDGSTPFRHPWMATSIRGRSWALHDGLLGEPFTRVTMYKPLGTDAGVTTVTEATWS
jgi:hypothetical protein